MHNKAFILTMDNGAEIFAKLPNPSAGLAKKSGPGIHVLPLNKTRTLTLEVIVTRSWLGLMIQYYADGR